MANLNLRTRKKKLLIFLLLLIFSIFSLGVLSIFVYKSTGLSPLQIIKGESQCDLLSNMLVERLGTCNREGIKRIQKIDIKDNKIIVNWAINNLSQYGVDYIWNKELYHSAKRDVSEILQCVIELKISCEGVVAFGSFPVAGNNDVEKETMVLAVFYPWSKIDSITLEGLTEEDKEIKQIIKQFLITGNVLGSKSQQKLNDSLLKSASEGWTHVAKYLIDQGADVNAENRAGLTPLRISVINGYREFSYLLIKSGAQITLEVAIEMNDVETVKRLLENDYVLNDTNSPKNETPLHIAAERGYAVLTELLLARDTRVNSKNKTGMTPIQLAVEQACIKSFRPRLRTTKEKKEVNVAKSVPPKNTNIDYMNLGLVELEVCYPLVGSVHGKIRGSGDAENYVKTVKLLLENGADMVVVDSLGKTPIHNAVSKGVKEIVEIFIKQDAPLNITTKEGNTPLHYAAHKDVIDLLVENGADIEARNNFYKYTPLHLAIEGRRIEAVEQLIDRGADINAKGRYGNTPLHLLCKNSYPYRVEEDKLLVEFLISKGADVNAENISDQKPIHLAIMAKNQALIEILKKYDTK